MLGCVSDAAAGAGQALRANGAVSPVLRMTYAPNSSAQTWSTALQGFSPWSRTPSGLDLLRSQPHWGLFDHPDPHVRSLAAESLAESIPDVAGPSSDALQARPEAAARLGQAASALAASVREDSAQWSRRDLSDAEQALRSLAAFDGGAPHPELSQALAIVRQARRTAPPLRAWQSWHVPTAPEAVARQAAPVFALRAQKAELAAVPQPSTVGRLRAAVKALWQKEGWAGKMALAANVPFLLLGVPQIVKSWGDIASGHGALLQGLSVPATAMITVGSLFMLMLAAKLRDPSLAAIQIAGLTMNFATLGLVVAAGFMSPLSFTALGAAAIASAGVAVASWRRPFPGWWNTLVGWLGWAAIALFMWFPIAQLSNDSQHPQAVAGLSVLSFALGGIGNLMTVPHALKSGNRMWFVGALWGAALGSLAVIVDVLTSGSLSVWIFGHGLGRSVSFWGACLAGVFALYALIQKARGRGQPPAPPVLPAAKAMSLAAPVGAAALDRRRVFDSPSRLDFLSPAQMTGLWWKVFRHKVAGLDDPAKLAKYDPTGIIGFCFGRAMAVHLLARRMGLSETSVRKLFIVGDLRSAEAPEWRFHVTTLVRGAAGRWYAIDPILEGPLPVEDWIARVQGTWDKQKKARLYLTPASVVIPDLSVVPDVAQEKGERLIELSFDPARRPGLAGEPKLGPQVYTVSDAAARRYFSAVDGQPPFDFAGITINGDAISFNGYFEDLLREINSPSAAPLGATRSLAMAVPSRLRSLSAPVLPLGLHIGRLSGREGVHAP